MMKDMEPIHEADPAGAGRSRSRGRGKAMSLERVASGTSLIDVLDRVVDKGIVIDAWVRVSLVGIDLLTFDAHVVVASIETYLRYAGPDRLGQLPRGSPLSPEFRPTRTSHGFTP